MRTALRLRQCAADLAITGNQRELKQQLPTILRNGHQRSPAWQEITEPQSVSLPCNTTDIKFSHVPSLCFFLMVGSRI
jgi:hypothetical protein